MSFPRLCSFFVEEEASTEYLMPWSEQRIDGYAAIVNARLGRSLSLSFQYNRGMEEQSLHTRSSKVSAVRTQVSWW